MAKIAILGFGTVGSGVYEVLCHNAASVSRRAGEPVEVKYILDPKDFTGNPVEPLVVKNIDVILQDPEIQVVVETIGGTRFAYPYVKACLESGRSVCTSNKEMVATYGAELLALAKEHGCTFLFEASFGSPPEIDAYIQPMIGWQGNIVRLFVDPASCRIRRLDGSRQRRIFYILHRHSSPIATTESPCCIRIDTVIKLMTEHQVQLMTVVKLAGIPVGVKIFEFLLAPRQRITGLKDILCVTVRQ